MIHEWFEVWAEETDDVPYLLILSPSLTEKDKFVIIDPKENNRVVDVLPDYDSARLWLLEDEFVLVRARMPIDK
jgi:hypothetical protein